MKTYKLMPEGFTKAIKKTLPIRILIMFFALACGVFVGTRDNNFDTNILFVFIPILLLVVIFTIYSAIKKEKSKWDSYELCISSDSVTLKQLYLPEIEIHKNNILCVEEFIDNGIIIKTDNKNKQINIPSSLIKYEEVKQQITCWTEIKKVERKNKNFVSLLVSILTIISFIIIFTSEVKILVVSVGIVFVIGLSWSMISILKNEKIVNKRMAYMVILPIIAAILRIILICIG